MSDVRVGFVGAGYMAQVAHIPCFQQAAGAKVTALASSRPRLLNQVADRFGIEKRYASHSELGADPDIDLAVVVVPPELNVDICAELLEAGKDVICEKPVSLRATDAERLRDISVRTGKRLLVGFMKRFDLGVRAAKAVVDGWLATGEAGRLLYARAHSFIGGDWQGNIGALFSTIKTDEPMSAKPATPMPDWLLEKYAGAWGPYYFTNHVHSHDMDLLGYFLGRDFRVCDADWSRDVKRVCLEYGDAVAQLETAKCGANTRWDEDLTLYFEGGSVRVKLPPPLLINVPAEVEIYAMGDRQEIRLPQVKYSWSFLEQAQNAVDVAAGKAEPICTIDDGLTQVRMTEAIFAVLAGS